MQVPYRKPGKYSQLSSDPHLTEEKFLALKKELERLKKIHPQAAHEVSRLAELGDFSENVEYQLAKGRLRGINNAILKIQKQLDAAVLITKPKNNSSVQLGHRVTIEVDGKEKIYQILGSTETDPAQGIISQNSPLGTMLLGKKVGETGKMKMGNREVDFKIITIQ